MSIKIYHGSPGSYKTSNCVYKDLPQFAFEGRVIVTNIRDLCDRNKIKSVLERRRNRYKIFPWQKKKYIPDSFDIINVEHETLEGKEKWARWFHWAPKGCVLFVDEAQRIWRKEWTAKNLHVYDYPGGTDKAKEDGRPEDFLTSFEMHRHHNWDFVLTAPGIKLIRPEIREIADAAYFHVNYSLIGFKGRFAQHYHKPSNNGSVSDTISSEYLRKIPKWVFRLYGSTATGAFSDTKSGSSIFKDKKILSILAFLFLLQCYYFPNFIALFRRLFLDDSVSVQNIQKPSSENSESNVSFDQAGFSFSGFDNLKLYYVGKYSAYDKITYLFEAREGDEIAGSIISSDFFIDLGYHVNEVSSSVVVITDGQRKIFCKRFGVINEKKFL